LPRRWLKSKSDSMSVSKAGAFLRLTRPFFLLGGVLLYLLGVSIALSAGVPFKLGLFILGQILVTSVQLMVHYGNEYYDRDVDRAIREKRTWFSGGSGVLPGGVLSPLVALRAGQVCAATSLVVLVIIGVQAPVLAILGLAEALIAWFYSAPPINLVNRGWGELAASMISAFCVPFTGLALQTGLNFIPPVLYFVSLPLVLIHISMLIAFEFPDLQADGAFGKRTLVVRLGLERAAWLHNALVVAAFVCYGLFIRSGSLGTAGRYIFIALPLAIWQMIRIGWQVRHPQATYHWLTTGAICLFGLTAILELLGFAL
jgi:1,4-dihydroxy-2-naphthoate polyprenyltransferase